MEKEKGEVTPMKQRKGYNKRQKTVASVGEGSRTMVMDSPNGGNLPKLGAIVIPALPLTPSNPSLDDLKCHECGNNGHFQKQCPSNKGSTSMHTCTVSPDIASTNWEDNKRRIRWKNEYTNQVHFVAATCPSTATCSCGTSAFDNTTPSFGRSSVSEQQPTLEEAGLASKQSDLFGKNNTTSAKTAFDASPPCRSASGVTNPKVVGQSDSCAFDASSMDALSCSTSPAVFGSQSSSSLPQACKSLSASCDVPPIPVVGFAFAQQPSVEAFGSNPNHLSPCGSSKIIGSSVTLGAPSPSAFGAGAANSPVFCQSSTPAFDTASGKPAPTSACDFQNVSSLCGSPSTPAFGSGYYTPAFKGRAMGHKSCECPSSKDKKCPNCCLCKKVGHMKSYCPKLGKDDQAQFKALEAPAISTAAAAQDKGKHPALLEGTSGFVLPSTTKAVGLTSTQSSPLENHCAIGSNTSFAVPSQYAFGTPSTTVFGRLSTSLMGKAGSTPALFGSATTSSSTSAFGSQSNMSRSFGTSSNSFGRVSSALFTFGCQTTTAGNLMATPENRTVISDKKNTTKAPYSSIQDICGKSVSIMDKSIFKDKQNEEVRQEEYHGNTGCDQEQAEACEQAQSVVVMSENNERSGDTPYRATKTSVWWDIENCQVPKGSDTYYIAQNISSALADAGYEGAVTISAYGDTHRIPNAVQQALSSTGIALNHVPAGVKDASDKKILVDMLFWAVDNPPPANYLLISGDRDFSNALHQLRLRRYNILLAHAPHVSQALVAAAKKVWEWGSLLSGGPPLPNLESGVKTLGPNRFRWKNPNARETLKTFSVRQSNEDCDIHSKNHASFPRLSMCETSEITGSKRARAGSPSHEIVCAKRPRDLVDSPERMPLRSMLHFDHEKDSHNTQPFKFSFMLANNDLSQNTNNHSSIAQANQQHIMLGPPHRLSMHKTPQMCNGHQNNGCQVHSSEVQLDIRHVLGALIGLKANKITPTEENISNCLQYGMGKRSINVKTALNHACEIFSLVKYNLSNDTTIYLGKNEKLWECVNVFDINDKHSEATWNAVRKFLSSENGQSAISSTECRYHAATVLKEACLHHFALGEILQLLNAVIKFRKWIVPALSGWQPLSFTL